MNLEDEDSITGNVWPFARQQPAWLSRRLTRAMFGAPSTMGIYLAGLCVANVFLWRRTTDDAIHMASAIALVLTAYRAVVLLLYRKSCAGAEPGDGSFFVTLYCAGAWLFSVDLAGLMVRTVVVGDLLPIIMAIVILSGYLVGLIMRAAVLRFAIPSMLLLFLPMIAAGAVTWDDDYLVIAILLLLLCSACVRYAFEARATIVAQLTAERQLSELVGRDPLTGLANRAGLDAYLESLRKAPIECRRPFSLAVLDLDGFKAVNDRLGHAAGDDLLIQVAMRIQNVLAGRHHFARVGGDEFVVIFEAALTQADAVLVCENLAAALRPAFDIMDASVHVSASIGLSRAHHGTISVEEALERADEALYSAKRSGRDRVIVAEMSASLAPDDRTRDVRSVRVTLYGLAQEHHKILDPTVSEVPISADPPTRPFSTVRPPTSDPDALPPEWPALDSQTEFRRRREALA